MSYYTLKEVEVDLHYLTRETAKRRVIETIKDCHSRKIPYVKFITGRGNHINANGERGVLYETFPSWMVDTEINYLV
jgi:DNA-nicking Smr family endonuclease